MNGQIVAEDAQRPVVARCIIVDMLIITVSYTDWSHRNPAQQEYIEPDVEEENHVIVWVASAHTIVQPYTVCLVSIRDLVTSMTVLSTRWHNHFGVWTQLAPW